MMYTAMPPKSVGSPKRRTGIRGITLATNLSLAMMPPFLLGAVNEGAASAAANAGIGKAAVDPTERVERRLHRRLDGSRIGDIADLGMHLAGPGRHGCRRTLVLLRVAAPDRDVTTLRVQRLRDAKADTAVAAGDDGGAAGEIKNAHGMFPFALGRDKACAQWRADVLAQAWTSASGKSNMGRDPFISSAQRNSA